MQDVPSYRYFVETPNGKYQFELFDPTKCEGIVIYKVLRIFLCTEGRIDTSSYEEFNFRTKVWEEVETCTIDEFLNREVL